MPEEIFYEEHKPSTASVELKYPRCNEHLYAEIPGDKKRDSWSTESSSSSEGSGSNEECMAKRAATI